MFARTFGPVAMKTLWIQRMEVAIDSLKQLEDKVTRVALQIRQLKVENAQLKKMTEDLQAELEELREGSSLQLREIEQFKRIHKEVLDRVGRIRERILNLEGPLKGSTS